LSSDPGSDHFTLSIGRLMSETPNTFKIGDEVTLGIDEIFTDIEFNDIQVVDEKWSGLIDGWHVGMDEIKYCRVISLDGEDEGYVEEKYLRRLTPFVDGQLISDFFEGLCQLKRDRLLV
jgi:hypothetical protein